MTTRRGSHGEDVQAGRPALSQTIVIGAGSLQCVPFQNATPGTYNADGTPVRTPNTTTHVRLVATSDCWVSFGSNPTAVSGGAASILLPAGVPEYFWVLPGERIAVIQNSAAGSLNIAELA